jgi:hypothetical protein
VKACARALQASASQIERTVGHINSGDRPDCASEVVQAHLDEVPVSAREIEHVDRAIQAPRSNSHTLGKHLVGRSSTWSRVVREHGGGHTR